MKIECYGTVIRGDEDTSEDQLATVCDNEFGLLLVSRFNAYEENQQRIKELEDALGKLLEFATLMSEQESVSDGSIDAAREILKKKSK